MPRIIGLARINMNWKSVLVTIISNGIFIYLAQKYISYSFDKKLEESKKDTAIYMLRYQTLHLKRAEAVEAIYTTLEKAIRYITDVMSLFQRDDNNEFLKRVDEARKLADEFKDTYSAKKIFLPPSISKKLDTLDKQMMTLWSDFVRNHPTISPDGNLDLKKWDKAWNSFSNDEVPIMKEQLEKEFRKLLGSDLD